jgi:hypothetical protein
MFIGRQSHGQYFCDHLNLLTHLTAQAQGLAIRGASGPKDTLVAPGGTFRFQAALPED